MRNKFFSKEDLTSLPQVTGLPFKSKLNVAETFSVNSVQIDPKRETQIAQIGSGIRGAEVRFTGTWIPGIGHPSWGPMGDSNTQFNGTNKWCVLLRVWVINVDASMDLVSVIPWPIVGSSNGVAQIGYMGGITSITVIVNDDKYDDNIVTPGNPLTAQVSHF